MLLGRANELPQPFAITFKIVHYETPQLVNWHFNLGVTELIDTAFASGILNVDSSSSQTNWYFRNDALDTGNQTFVAIPASGAQTSNTFPLPGNVVGLAMYRITGGTLSGFVRGREYLARARQYNGADWGSYYTFKVIIP